jgi:hypothetical protein
MALEADGAWGISVLAWLDVELEARRRGGIP